MHGHDTTGERLGAQLRRMAETLDDASIVFIAELPEREVIACCVTFTSAQGLHAYKMGLDYEASRRCAAYFNVAYYAPLGHAIARGLPRLQLGPAALETKLHRGATLESRWFGLWLTDSDASVARAARRWNELQRLKVGTLLRQFRRSLTVTDEAAFDLVLGPAEL
jgi:predicted N-acyltransferase